MSSVNDLSLKFFKSIYFDKYAKGTPSNEIEVDVPVEINIEYYNPDDTSNIITTKTYQETIKMLQSKLDDNEFVVNYNSNINNTITPIEPRVETYSNSSISAILDWSNKYPQLTISPRHVVLLKDFQVYPPNKFMVLRRFDNGVGHDLFQSKNRKPLVTMVGYYDLEQSPISIKFGEEWVKMRDTMYSVIQDIIGIKFNSMPGIGSMASSGESNPFAQDFMYTVGRKLGFVGTEDPYGEPNLIYEAATREVSGEKLGVGLMTNFNFTFETVYEYKEIQGLNSKKLLQGLLFDAQKMGTSNAKFVATDKALDATASVFNSLQTGNISSLLTALRSEIKEAAKSTLSALTNMDLTGDGTSNPLISMLDAGFGSIAKSRYNRYKWKMMGVMGAMSGQHTAPWHITLGNPMSPWFSMGNLILLDMNIEPMGELMYDDTPSEWKITVMLENGRAMGGNEIFGCFTPGSAREYTSKDELTKAINVSAPYGTSVTFKSLNNLTIEPDGTSRHNDNAKSEEVNKNDIENDPDSIDPAGGLISNFSSE